MPPNILLLALESTPVTHLSGYGYSKPTTPHLDQFAAEGVLYEQAISAAAWTLPAHASLFTGLYPSQHGTDFGRSRLPEGAVTLAEMLSARGYDTAAFSTNDWVNEGFGFNRGFKTFRWAKRTMEWLAPVFPNETLPEKGLRVLRDVVYPVGYRNNRLMLDFIAQARKAGRPFFAYTLYFEPHYPYRPRWPHARKFLQGQSKPWWRVNLDPDRYMAGAVQMSAEDLEVIRALYDSRLAGADEILGRFLEELRRQGALDDTVVIVVADHGENLGEHGLMSHQYCVYDTLVRVPLIIRYPPLFPAGRRVPDLVQTLEIFTTLMDILGIAREEVPNDLRGRSLVPVKLAGQPLPFAVSEYLVPNLARMRRLFGNYDLGRYDRSLRAIRQNGHKAIFGSDGGTELYDLSADPGETRNLAGENPTVVLRLRSQLEDWLVSVGAAEGREPQAEMNPVLMKRLQDLGYF